jgi:hypothetical protein
MGTSCQKKTEKAGSNFSYNLQTLQEEEFDGSKTYIDWFDNLTKWNNGDGVRIYNVNLNDYTSTVSDMFAATDETGVTHTALSGGSVGAMQDCYMAFYPGENAMGQIEEGNREHFIINEEQIAEPFIRDGGANLAYGAVAMASRIEEGTNFPFSNICGVARFKLKFANEPNYPAYNQELVVSKITVTDNFFHLNGEVSFFLPELEVTDLAELINVYKAQGEGWEQTMQDYKDQIGYQTVPGTYSISLSTENVVNEPLTSQQSRDYIIGLRPFVLGQGFVVDVEFENGMTAHITKWENPNINYTIEPNKIKNFVVFVDTYMAE